MPAYTYEAADEVDRDAARAAALQLADTFVASLVALVANSTH
ncbi:hypothetical protein [Aurantiacibacter gilvus]|uniref:Uncharacterized protein n=1 Tax=Aurantiacibacter gilvus TaxID=3139141 RepID=A0ABU9ICU5_9SPHN